MVVPASPLREASATGPAKPVPPALPVHKDIFQSLTTYLAFLALLNNQHLVLYYRAKLSILITHVGQTRWQQWRGFILLFTVSSFGLVWCYSSASITNVVVLKKVYVPFDKITALIL